MTLVTIVSEAMASSSKKRAFSDVEGAMCATQETQEFVTIGTDCSGLETPVLALQALGVQVHHSFSCDCEPYVRRHIAANFHPVILYTDLLARDNQCTETPSVDIYTAGFPCQPWSLAGARWGFEDARGSVFYGVCDYIASKTPICYLLENVPGLLSHNSGKSWERVLFALESLNRKQYKVWWKVLQSLDFGSAQSRKRLYIIGVRKDKLQCNFEWPVHPMRPVGANSHGSLDDVLDPYDPEAPPELNIDDVAACVRELGEGPARALWLLRDRVRRQGVDPSAECVLDIDSSLDRAHWMAGRSPALLRSRARGYFLLRRCRRMRVHEMLKLQGVTPLPVQVVTDAQLAQMAGNGMSQPVLEAIFPRLLPAAGIRV